jgi:GAF domain-containing protein
VTNVPSGYIDVASGLGAAAPRNILVLPVVFEGQVKGVLELGSFERFPDTHQAFLEQLMESVGIVINTIEANMRTEDLLTQSQSLAKELGSRQEELQRGCSRTRTRKSSARTARWSRRARTWRRRPGSSPSRRSTSPSSSPTCRTSCARR